MSFQEFPLHPTILKNLSDMGFTAPTDIQRQIMPMALEGKDVSGLSRTGTGKTAAFLLPTLQRLTQLPEDRICLCLAPTRELAQQIQAEAERIAKDLGLGSVSLVGGMSPDDQIAALRNGARIVTGTPGRVIDLFKGRHLDLDKVAVLVFDEADRMFDMGFIDDMHFILKKVNRDRQILLFSATMNFSVLNMIYEYGANPQEINVSRDQMTADKIQQLLYHVGDREKANALLGVCRKFAGEKGTIIVFVNYKERVPWVAALLTKNGIPAQGLSSLLRQEKRNKIIQGFKSGQFRALVATDVASRGLDVDDISLVVNYHLPEEAATYVHRIGRTARAGRDGIAVSLSGSEDAFNQMRVEEFLGSKLPVEWLGEEDMPKDVKMPRREDEDRDGEEEREGAAPGGPAGGRGRREGGRDRGGRGGERGGRDRGPRREREARPARNQAGSEEIAPAHADLANEVSEDAVMESASPAPTGPRSMPVPRETPLPIEAPTEAAEGEAAPARESRRDREREPRRERDGERAPREARGERGERGDRGDRGGRGRDRDRGRGRGRGRDRDRERDQPAGEVPSAKDMPNPLTGAPIIYDMKTGAPKNRTDAEYKGVLKQYEGRQRSSEAKYASSNKKKAAPAIIKKISSKVTALFGNKRG